MRDLFNLAMAFLEAIYFEVKTRWIFGHHELVLLIGAFLLNVFIFFCILLVLLNIFQHIGN